MPRRDTDEKFGFRRSSFGTGCHTDADVVVMLVSVTGSPDFTAASHTRSGFFARGRPLKSV
jgi:hypothetical protein